MISSHTWWFEDEATLKAHKREAHKNEPDGPPKKVCPHCGKEFSSSGLYFHIDKVHKQPSEEFKCSECDPAKCFPSKSALKTHHHIIHARVQCPECGKLVKPTRMKEHVHDHHTSEENKNFICQLCVPIKGFFDERNYQTHMNGVHLGIRPHKCTLGCINVAFADNSNLNAHIRAVHHGIKRNSNK